MMLRQDVKFTEEHIVTIIRDSVSLTLKNESLENALESKILHLLDLPVGMGG